MADFWAKISCSDFGLRNIFSRHGAYFDSGQTRYIIKVKRPSGHVRRGFLSLLRPSFLLSNAEFLYDCHSLGGASALTVEPFLMLDASATD